MEKHKSINKMETMPIGKLMLSMGILIICSMVLQALYNIVDSAFTRKNQCVRGLKHL